MKPLYLVALLAGLGLAAYIYLVKFDDLSETELVTLSPLWFLLLVFGIVGLKAEQATGLVERGEAADMHEGLNKSIGTSPLVHLAFVALPSLIFNPAKVTKSPAVYSLILTGIWAVLLYVFFLGIFPNL